MSSLKVVNINSDMIDTQKEADECGEAILRMDPIECGRCIDCAWCCEYDKSLACYLIGYIEDADVHPLFEKLQEREAPFLAETYDPYDSRSPAGVPCDGMLIVEPYFGCVMWKPKGRYKQKEL